MDKKRGDIVNQSELKTSHEGRSLFLYHEKMIPEISKSHFEPDYWKKKNAVEGKAKGRGITWFVHHQGDHWVLRHYYRGGLVGRFLNDQYLYFGFTRTRAYREFMLLWKLRALELPVPQPIAIHIEHRSMFTSTSDILSTRITDSQSLVDSIKTAPLPTERWQYIGMTIRRFHDHNVYHHDLNANNILLDKQGKIWLIDFDQASFRKNNSHWKQQNLSRLHRSFHKEMKKHKHFYWQESDWLLLLKGYNHDSQSRSIS